MRWILVVCLAALAAGVSYLFMHYTMPSDPITPERFTTSDGISIAANYYPAPDPKGWLLMVHMMPATKESWDVFARMMQEQGYAGVAIDLRGHGASEGGPDGYAQFTDAQHQASIHDVEAAWDFLRAHGATPAATTLIGASIGANLSLEFLAAHPDIPRAALLSAGLNYHGVTTAASAQALSPKQSVVLVTSKDDDGNVADNEVLYKTFPTGAQNSLVIYDHGGHGMALLSAKGELDLLAALEKFIIYGSIN